MKKKVFTYQNGQSQKEIENKLDMTGFENAIEAIKEIRKYKSEK